jgi:hypothetical protein
MGEASRPVVPTVPVAVLEAALQGRATAETIGRVLGGAIVDPLDEHVSAAHAMATLGAGLAEYGFGEATCGTRGALFVVNLEAPSFRLGALAESFVASVLGTACGLEVGALAFADGDGGWAVAVLDPGVAAFLRARHVETLERAVDVLAMPGAA